MLPVPPLRPSRSSSVPARRSRAGRLLVEALVALVLAAAAVAGAASVRNATLALGDASAHAVLAATHGQEGAAVALRAPCELTAQSADRAVTATHSSRQQVVGGTLAELWVRDRWVVAGLGWHRVGTASGRIGVRCE